MEKRKILVVDDDEIIRRLVLNILGDKYDILEADSGKAAIELYEKHKPDLILSDLMMPEMDGFEMMEELRSRYNFVIPVMYMTANAGEDTEEKSLTTGAVDYIRKPFKADVLLKRIERAIANLEQIRGLKRAAEVDPMTGLFNKVTSASKIDELASKGQGILMMLDLDSFKLVNDIYGHDKGDKILIKFAEIIKGILRSTDVVGRVGGDEFVAFCQNTRDERMLHERCDYLNRKIVSYARECLAEDMNIPLGCSIGAVICPDEGKDYATLFKKADQALYSVKQNGKHGYALYKPEDAESKEEKEELGSDLRMILGERNNPGGAYMLPIDSFRILYRFLLRFVKNYPWDIHIVVFTVDCPKGSSECVDKFIEIETSSLRGSDVVAKFGDNQILTILLKTNEEDWKVPVERVMNKWKECELSSQAEVTYTAEDILKE